MLHQYKCVYIAIQHKYNVAKYDNVCASQRLCFASILRCFAADRFAATTVDLTLHVMSVIYTLYIYVQGVSEKTLFKDFYIPGTD